MEVLLEQLSPSDSRDQWKILEQIKVLGRDSKQAAILAEKSNLATLASFGFLNDNPQVSSEALKCIANVLWLHESARRTLVDLNHSTDLVKRLDTSRNEDEFLASRILFLLTYNKDLDFRALVEKDGLADIIYRQLDRHAKHVRTNQPEQPRQPITSDMALSETLKLLFNITHFYPDLTKPLSSTVSPLSEILVHCKLSKPALQPPVTLLINALMNLDLASMNATNLDDGASQPKDTSNISLNQLIDRLIAILTQSLEQQSEKDLDSAAASLVTLLRRIYESGTSSVQLKMRETLLPSVTDRERPLGQGDSLPARLLRLSVSPNANTLRENVSGLLYELSDQDATKFIHNIGYGYASGFLMNHNIPLPTDTNLNADDAGADDDDHGEPINPITGQKLSAEQRGTDRELHEMSEDEKEREAERLFVLFERLRATGVVDVQNPVQRAVDEGRFEELPD